MKPEEAGLLLRLHNKWRRGDESVPQMLDPKILGEAIDVAISAIADRGDLLAAIKALVDERQPLGIERETYQTAIRIIIALDA